MMQGIINTWFLRYVIAAMSQEFDKGFSYLAMQISSNRGKIRFESLGIGCKPSTLYMHACFARYSLFSNINQSNAAPRSNVKRMRESTDMAGIFF